MSLDMYYFDKNKEFVTQTASTMEETIREAGFDFVNCTDEFLKEITEGAGNSYARALYMCLKSRRDLQRDP